MICTKCGVEYSDKVYRIHKNICKGKDVVEEHEELEQETEELQAELEESEDAIRAKAKEAGIKSWHLKSIDTLKEELGVI